MGGMKAYNAANQSEADMLLSENVEALSSGDCHPGVFYCIPRPGSCCYWGGQVVTNGKRFCKEC